MKNKVLGILGSFKIGFKKEENESVINCHELKMRVSNEECYKMDPMKQGELWEQCG